MNNKFPIVNKLRHLVMKDACLEKALLSGILKADIGAIRSLDAYYSYLDDVCSWIPIMKEKKVLYDLLVKFYWLLDNDSESVLTQSQDFRFWVLDFFDLWGKFLDSEESLKYFDQAIKDLILDTKDTDLHNEYKSINAFITRKKENGVTKDSSSKSIVFPTDGVLEAKEIIENSNVTLSSI